MPRNKILMRGVSTEDKIDSLIRVIQTQSQATSSLSQALTEANNYVDSFESIQPQDTNELITKLSKVNQDLVQTQNELVAIQTIFNNYIGPTKPGGVN